MSVLLYVETLFYRFTVVVLPIFAEELGSKLDRETKIFTTYFSKDNSLVITIRKIRTTVKYLF